MVQQATRSGNQQIDTLGQLLGLCLSVGAANDDAVRLGVVLHELTGDTKNLQGQLSGGRDDNDAGAISRLEPQGAENFDRRNQESKRFTGTGFGGAEDVFASQQRGNSLCG